MVNALSVRISPRALSLCVRTLYTDTPRTWPRGLELGRNIMLFGVMSPFATHLALCNSGAYLFLKRLEFGRRMSKDTCQSFDVRFALYTGGSRLVAKETARIRVPLLSLHCTIGSALARKRKVRELRRGER